MERGVGPPIGRSRAAAGDLQGPPSKSWRSVDDLVKAMGMSGTNHTVAAIVSRHKGCHTIPGTSQNRRVPADVGLGIASPKAELPLITTIIERNAPINKADGLMTSQLTIPADVVPAVGFEIARRLEAHAQAARAVYK
jgi:hypothetical protein